MFNHVIFFFSSDVKRGVSGERLSPVYEKETERFLFEGETVGIPR